MDDRVLPAILVIGVLALLLLAMYLGWKRRQRSQSALPRPLPVPDELGAELVTLDLLYVASTTADDPLDRIAVRGLGFRARASVAVYQRGIALGLAGQPDLFIPVADITRVDRATWTIDRVVEREGLVRITWGLGGAAGQASDSAVVIDSYLRVNDAVDSLRLIGAIEAIMSAPAGSGPTEERR